MTIRKPRSRRPARLPEGSSGSPKLDPERLAAFERAIDAIRREVEDELGAEDVAHLLRMRAISRRLEIAGRVLLHVSLDPATFALGVLALFGHKQLEAIEIGHTALHGAYDRLEGAEAFRSASFHWKLPVDEASWRREHNVLHHQYTNIVGKDPDLRFGPVRLSPRVPYERRHVLQPYSALATWLYFDLAIHAHATGLLDLHFHRNPVPEVLHDYAPETVEAAHRAAARKVVRYYGRELVLFPALAGPFFWKVALGNLLSELGRNVYSAATIYCGHVNTKDYAPPTRARGRGEWYLMQVEAAHDFEVPGPISVLCGALDRQIEHHLFPRLPPNRLRAIAPRVREVCEEHGVTYRTASWPRALGAALRRLRELAAPDA